MKELKKHTVYVPYTYVDHGLAALVGYDPKEISHSSFKVGERYLTSKIYKEYRSDLDNFFVTYFGKDGITVMVEVLEVIEPSAVKVKIVSGFLYQGETTIGYCNFTDLVYFEER